jgi:hypothetical protein
VISGILAEFLEDARLPGSSLTQMNLAKSFSRISYAAVPMLFATVALAQMPMRWTPGAAGIPGDAMPVADSSGLYICRASYNGGVHPGSIQPDGCHIGWAGSEVVIQNYAVLAGQGMWVPSDQDANAAFPAGQENRVPLLLCRAAFNNVIFPGKIVNGSCNIAAAGAERVVPSEFQLFYPAVRSVSGDQPVRVTFHNPLSSAVTYYCIGYNGASKKYGDIPPGGDVVLQTFASHPWLFDVGIRRLSLYTASAAINQYLAVASQPAGIAPSTFLGGSAVAIVPVAPAAAFVHEEREALRAGERAIAREQEFARERQMAAGERAQRKAAERFQHEVEKQRLETQRQAMRAQQQAMRAQEEAVRREAFVAQQRAQRDAAQRQEAAQRQAMFAQQRAQQQAAQRHVMIAQQQQREGVRKPGCQPS